MSAPQLRSPFPTRLVVSVLLVLALAMVASLRLELNPLALLSLDSLRAVASRFAEMWPLDGTQEVIEKAWRGTVETLAISIVGTIVGAVLGLVLMPLACQSLLVRGPLVNTGRGAARELGARAIHWAARLVANVLRTVPYFVWAIVFLFMFGLGPFAGAIAIALHTGGVFARLYALALDQLDPRPLVALRDNGARPTHVLAFGMLPAVRPALVSYTLYRWEVNIREAAVLGIIGPIGIGFHIEYALGIFDLAAVGSYLVAVMILVVLVDVLSAWIRKRIV